jgi:type I restriction enzyme S subunit
MSTTTLRNEKKQTLIPQLRFKEFDGEFEQIKFGKLYSFHTTNSFSRDKLNYEIGNVYNIHYGDIHTKFQFHFYLRNENVPLIIEEVDLTKIKEESYCKNGDIIIADASEDYADIGKSIELIDIDNVKLLAGLHTFLARPITDKTAIGFTSYLLKSWKLRKQIMTIAQGTKVLSLSTTRVANLKLNLPTLPEQQKIASFLSAVDEKIQQLTRKVTLLEQYKKGVMQQLFSGKLRFKDENGKDYPDWEEKKLGEVCTFFSGGTPTSTNQKYYSGTIPFIGSGNIYDSEVFSFITEEALNNSSAKIIKKGDLLYALYGANSGEVSISKMEGAINQAVLCIRNKESIEYLYYVLLSNKDKIVAKFIQGGQGNLSSQIIKRLKYNFPCLKEQQKIANFLSGIDSKIEKVNQQLAQTQTFKKGLLQQMFV